MKVFGMTWVGWMNFLVFQWFGVRLSRITLPRFVVYPGGPIFPEVAGWAWMTRVVPLTGWWSDYRYF